MRGKDGVFGISGLICFGTPPKPGVGDERVRTLTRTRTCFGMSPRLFGRRTTRELSTFLPEGGWVGIKPAYPLPVKAAVATAVVWFGLRLAGRASSSSELTPGTFRQSSNSGSRSAS